MRVLFERIVSVRVLQSQFRFDNECHLNLPDNHKRVSESEQASSMTQTASDARTVSTFRFILFFVVDLCAPSLSAKS